MEFAPRTRICNDNYELLAKADSGGFGSVWQARNVHLNKTVALKFLDRASASNVRDSLRDEGQKLARVAGQGAYSRNIVYVHHFYPGDENTPPFLELEWVDGGNLGQLLGRENPLPLKTLLRMAVDVAAGLATAHRLGLIHCDLKPSNILCTSDRVFKLTDFGLSRLSNSDGSRTPLGGTLPYMSPEQFGSAGDVTPITDIYSLGCVLYQCCEGHTPFGEPHWGWAQYQNAHGQSTAPSLKNPLIPAELAQLIHECLRKTAAERPTAEQLHAQLDRLEKSLADGSPRAPVPAWRPAAPGSSLVRLPSQGAARYVHPLCDLEFVKFEPRGEGQGDCLLVPTRLLTNRDYLRFLRVPAHRDWQPSLLAARRQDGGYVASWSGDLPSLERGGQPLHSVPYAGAAAFVSWLGGRLPEVTELREVLAHPLGAGLKAQIEHYLRSAKLDFVQFWCAAEEPHDFARMLRHPDCSRLAPQLDTVSRPRHFCFPHYLFVPIVTQAQFERFTIQESSKSAASRPDIREIEAEMEQFIDHFFATNIAGTPP